MAVASRVTQPRVLITHTGVVGRGGLLRACDAWAESSRKQKLCCPGKTGVLNQDKMSRWHFCRNGFSEKFNFLGPEVVFSLCVAPNHLESCAASLGTGKGSPGMWRALILPTSSWSSPFAAGTCQEDRELGTVNLQQLAWEAAVKLTFCWKCNWGMCSRQQLGQPLFWFSQGKMYF